MSTSQQTTTNTPSNASMRKVAAASLAGAVLEWYDFFIFGTASALVFGKLFFPGENPTAGMIAAFATFGVGFLARPLGGLYFGHLGDRYGRKKSLLATLLIVGIATTLIGLLPTWQTAGYWAPVMLLVLRLAQGFGLGGEYGGAALLTIEHAPEAKRGFWGSLPQAAASGGILLATGAFALVSQLSEEDLLSWGWRLPFLFSAVMLIVGLLIRLRIDETPEFEAARTRAAARRNTHPERAPLLQLLKDHPGALLMTIGARLAETTASNIVNTFAIVYVTTQLAMPRATVLNGVLTAAFIGLLMCPLFGAISDRIGRRRVYMMGAAFMALFTVPFFLLLGTQSPMWILVGIVVAYNLGPTSMFAVQATFFSELFGPGVRYTGLSIAYQFSAIIGGFTPLIAAWLLQLDGGKPWYVAGYLILICLMSFACARRVRGDARITAAQTPKAADSRVHSH